MKTFRLMAFVIVAFSSMPGVAIAANPAAVQPAAKTQPASGLSPAAGPPQTVPAKRVTSPTISKTQGKVMPVGSKIIMADFKIPVDC